MSGNNWIQRLGEQVKLMLDDSWAEKLAEEVEVERQTELVQFITTGEASAEFFSHLEVCSACKIAAEKAFKIMSRQFEDLAKIISQD